MGESQASNRSLGLAVGSGFVAKLVQGVLGFGGTIIFARVLGPTDFGGYYLLLTLIGMVERPISGMSGATQKRFAESDAPRRKILGSQILFNIGYILLVGIGIILFHDYVISYTGIANASWLFMLLFVTLVMFSPYQRFLVSLGRVDTQTWIDTLRSIVTFGLQILFVLLGLAATGMVFGLAGATLLMIPCTHWFLRTAPELPDKETVSSIWEFAKYSIPATFVSKAYDRFDILLLGLLAAPSAAGQYEAAYKLTVPATFIAGVVGGGLMARATDLVSRGESINEDVKNSLAFTSIIAIPVFFGALAISDVIIVTAYGSEYRAATWLLVGIALYRVFQTQSSILIGLLSALDRPDVEMSVSTVALILNIILGVILFYQYGPLGVVIATVIAEVLRYATFHVLIIREQSIALLPKALYKQMGAGVVMCAAVELGSRFVAVGSWRQLLLLIGLGATTYFFILIVISHHFRITVRSVINEALAEYIDTN